MAGTGQDLRFLEGVGAGLRSQREMRRVRLIPSHLKALPTTRSPPDRYRSPPRRRRSRRLQRPSFEPAVSYPHGTGRSFGVLCRLPQARYGSPPHRRKSRRLQRHGPTSSPCCRASASGQGRIADVDHLQAVGRLPRRRRNRRPQRLGRTSSVVTANTESVRIGLLMSITSRPLSSSAT